MSLLCDWCGREIQGKDEEGFALELVPFRPLDLGGVRKANLGPVIVGELHLHGEPCREAFLRNAINVAADHEPTAEELEFDHRAARELKEVDDDPEAAVRKKELDSKMERREKWEALSSLEQQRIVLEAIGDLRLTNTEILDRINSQGEFSLWGPQSVGDVTRGMFTSGELEREEGQFGKSRFRYSRRKPSEELKALEKELEDGGSDGSTNDERPSD